LAEVAKAKKGRRNRGGSCATAAGTGGPNASVWKRRRKGGSGRGASACRSRRPWRTRTLQFTTKICGRRLLERTRIYRAHITAAWRIAWLWMPTPG